MKKRNIDILTYTTFENLFLLDNEDVDCLINFRIRNFDPIESICFSSFLNMVSQTTNVNTLLELQRREMEKLIGRSLEFPQKVVIVHRDNLIHYISAIIEKKINGTENITGESNKDNSLKYYQTLLLINNKIDFLKYQNFEREIIKSFPYAYHNVLFGYYEQRIIRYSIIYNKILPNDLRDNQKNFLLAGINLIEKKYNLRFKDYIDTIKGLFIWFLGAEEKGINTPHFSRDNIGSFYIHAENFPTKDKFISTINALSKNLKGFVEEFAKERKDEIDNDIFNCFQRFFDYPIFKINNSQFCIIDFKFLIEGICSGLIWKIDSIIKNNDKVNYSIQNIREQYGYLIEKYFCFLVEKIFSDPEITYDQANKPDCILEIKTKDEDYIVLIEFTTKNYRISSLYNKSSDNFKEDLYRILFSTRRNDKGKFINLNNYVEQHKLKNKKILPILLTESFIGDFDLLNRFDNILNKKIQEHNLENLIVHKPIIMNLDDLETFWAISSVGKEKEEFVASLIDWEKGQKGKYFYSFANFISDGKRISNNNYAKIFSFNKICA